MKDDDDLKARDSHDCPICEGAIPDELVHLWLEANMTSSAPMTADGFTDWLACHGDEPESQIIQSEQPKPR